jgi:hypothetical protein
MGSTFDESVDLSDPDDVRDSLDSLSEHRSTMDKIKGLMLNCSVTFIEILFNR